MNKYEQLAMGKLAEFSERGSKTGATQRMRIYSLHEDQVEIITAALEHMREESETEYDGVALTYICLAYLNFCASYEVPKWAKQGSTKLANGVPDQPKD